MKTVRLEAMGRAVDVVGSQTAVEAVKRDWARCLARDIESSESVPVVFAGGGERASTPGLATRITLKAVDGLAGTRLMLHACGVAREDGRVLILVGPSGAGKSTAAAALCRESFGYVSDEAIAVGRDFSVSPYPKPLLVRQEGSGPKQVLGPDQLGLRRCPPLLVASRLVVLRRDGTWPARLQPLSLPEAVSALIADTSALADLPEPMQAICRLVDQTGGVYALHYAEIADAAALLRAHMSNECLPSTSPWVPVPATEKEWSRQPPAGGPLLVRGSYTDAVTTDDGVLIVREDDFAQLQGIGATVWLASGEGAQAAHVHDFVRAEHGWHPRADELITTAVEDLVRVGLLRVLYPSECDAGD